MWAFDRVGGPGIWLQFALVSVFRLLLRLGSRSSGSWMLRAKTWSRWLLYARCTRSCSAELTFVINVRDNCGRNLLDWSRSELVAYRSVLCLGAEKLLLLFDIKTGTAGSCVSENKYEAVFQPSVYYILHTQILFYELFNRNLEPIILNKDDNQTRFSFNRTFIIISPDKFHALS